jgi:hypothetical protein
MNPGAYYRLFSFYIYFALPLSYSGSRLRKLFEQKESNFKIFPKFWQRLIEGFRKLWMEGCPGSNYKRLSWRSDDNFIKLFFFFFVTDAAAKQVLDHARWSNRVWLGGQL